MKSHYILITILIFFVNNILIWYQLNGQLVWDFWKSVGCEIYGICNFNVNFSNYDLVVSWGGYNFKNFGNYIASFYYNAIAVALKAFKL